jgi:hypothetical protein
LAQSKRRAGHAVEGPRFSPLRNPAGLGLSSGFFLSLSCEASIAELPHLGDAPLLMQHSIYRHVICFVCGTNWGAGCPMRGAPARFRHRSGLLLRHSTGLPPRATGLAVRKLTQE